MIATTGRSARRSTPSIIAFSWGTKMPAWVPSAISDLTSSSVTVEVGFCSTRSRRSSASVEIRSSHTAGAATRDMPNIGRATKAAMRSGLLIAMRLGTSSPTTSDR